jgi:hypothetical protein
MFLDRNHRTVFCCCVLARKHTSLYAVFVSFQCALPCVLTSQFVAVCNVPTHLHQQSVAYHHTCTNRL